jgi:hypothetical protein
MKIGRRDFLTGADATDIPDAETAVVPIAIAGADDNDDDAGGGKGEACAPEDPPATAGLDAGVAGVAAEADCAELRAAALACEPDSCAAGTEPELWARRPDSVSRFSR